MIELIPLLIGFVCGWLAVRASTIITTTRPKDLKEARACLQAAKKYAESKGLEYFFMYPHAETEVAFKQSVDCWLSASGRELLREVAQRGAIK